MEQGDLYQDLVLAILAVNSYPLERVYPLKDALRREGLFNSSLVAEWDHPTTIRHLVAAGYERGVTMNSIFASRIQELALFAKSGGLDAAWQHVTSGAGDQANAILARIHGVGPAVLRNFWLLQEHCA